MADKIVITDPATAEFLSTGEIRHSRSEIAKYLDLESKTYFYLSEDRVLMPPKTHQDLNESGNRRWAEIDKIFDETPPKDTIREANFDISPSGPWFVNKASKWAGDTCPGMCLNSFDNRILKGIPDICSIKNGEKYSTSKLIAYRYDNPERNSGLVLTSSGNVYRFFLADLRYRPG